MNPKPGTGSPRTATTPPRELDALAVSAAWLLGHERHRVLLCASGAGASFARDHALTRGPGDRIGQREGFWIHVRDLDDGRVTSPTPLPWRRGPEGGAVVVAPGSVTFTRRDAGLELALEVAVHPDQALELRRLTVRERSGRARRLDVTGIAEVVLHHPAADAGHPAFARLFVQTEAEPARGAVLARRRPRSPEETHPWMVAALLGAGTLEWDTDRARVVGRGRATLPPRALARRDALSGAVGNVLDPVFALRRGFTLAAHGEARFTFVLGSAPDRGAALALTEGWDDARIAETLARAGDAARERAEALGLDEVGAVRAAALAGAMLTGDRRLMATEASAGVEPDPSRLAALGLTPGRPLVLAEAARLDAATLAALVASHQWWHASGLAVDTALVWDAGSRARAGSLPAPPGLFALRREALAGGDLERLRAHARVVVEGPLPDPAALEPVAPLAPADPPPPARGERLPDERLRRANGYGGFSADGREYVIRMPVEDGAGPRRPPAPWVNVIAHEGFGVLVSETGSACTWSGNSREHRLTPWSNDALLDPHGEAFYLRDDATGALFSPLPGPAPGAGDYVARHGIGVSRWRHASDGLGVESELFVARRDAVRVLRVHVTHHGPAPRALSFASYQRLVLGVLPEDALGAIVTALDPASGVLTARRRGAGDFAGIVAFAALVPPTVSGAVSHTTDREAFLGRLGTAARPAMLARGGALDGRTGAGLDPCFAQQVAVTLAPGERVTCAFLLGAAPDEAEARARVAGLRAPGALDAALADALAEWTEATSGLTVETPSEPLDLMLNGWLAYQTLSCRIQGRTAFYQSGGAYGFRDQLQDSAAMLSTAPERTRAQLLLHAAHQFVEGDVLHWWHPPRSRGIRTRFADDLLWLPWLTAGYVATTGDAAVLDESVPFLTARALAAGEDEAFLTPADAGVRATLYEHACRAIERSLALGAHGLPLFGTGDWNDGMNRVGREGRGESVWMGFFLYAVIGDFLPLVEARGEDARATRWREHQRKLAAALDGAGWDGEWYRRAYYDDGTPLGTREGDECRIDALAQAWAVISGAVDRTRAARAMDAVERELVSERDGLIRLLTPPFEHTPHDPGYIKGYVPGVRENGGQYTHAALWVVRALAELGRRERAATLLEMLTPVAHADDPARIATYQVEPYVVAADVYGAPPHVGRGGWTWYTGSSGWMIRVALENVLGLRLEHGRTLAVKPCIPVSWPGYSVRWRLPGGAATLAIAVRAGGGSGAVREARLDGVAMPVERGAARIALPRDGGEHRVEIVLD